MQYVWIVMLAIADLLWAIVSVVDIVRTIKEEHSIDFDDFDPVAQWFIIIHLGALFVGSFIVWLMGVVPSNT